jgi:hypothetical protein
MISSGRRLLLVLALVGTLAVPAARAATLGCPADTKLVHQMSVTLNRSLTISNDQVKLLMQLVSLQTSRQPVPPELVDQLHSLTDQNRRVLASGVKRLKALRPGTPQGRAFKNAALRYFREAVQPANECIGKAADAKTLPELSTSVQCFQSAKRKEATLQTLVNAKLVKLKGARRCTLVRKR